MSEYDSGSDISWNEIKEWVERTMEKQRSIPDWSFYDFDETLAYDDGLVIYYKYDSCTPSYLTFIEFKKNKRSLYRYCYGGEDPLEIEQLPALFREIQRKIKNVRVCPGCNEYHDLIPERDGGGATYCGNCYPLVASKGTYGICTLCKTDQEGIWFWIGCGHVFHYSCIFRKSYGNPSCPVCLVRHSTEWSNYL